MPFCWQFWRIKILHPKQYKYKLIFICWYFFFKIDYVLLYTSIYIRRNKLVFKHFKLYFCDLTKLEMCAHPLPPSANDPHNNNIMYLHFIVTIIFIVNACLTSIITIIASGARNILSSRLPIKPCNNMAIAILRLFNRFKKLCECNIV